MGKTTKGAELPGDIEKHLESYVAAFNANDADAVNALYTDEAVAVWERGKPVSGQARRDSVKEFFATARPQIAADVREAYVTGDTALLVVDWTMQVDDGKGGREQLVGVGLDVLRRTEDGGAWLYAIDDPFGEEPPAAA
ncbi:nuclear transport factor 2 family protein [Streptomyces sp. Je 1-332]|uniref:YybH family protein n=1 Tax=Streptomyces sp. Je 1-332 TaxID=3231270 RepID=UPI0034597144